MPESLAALFGEEVAADIVGFFGWLGGSTAGAIVARVVILGAAARALARRPGGAGAIGGVISAQGRNLSVRQPIPPWQVVIGQSRVGGDITFMFLGTDKKYLHIVITLACHVSEEIGDVWLDDEVVTSGMLNGNGEVTSGKFSRYDQIARRDDFTGGGITVVTVSHTVSSVQAVTVTVDTSDGGSDTVQLGDASPSPPGPGQYSRSGDVFTLGFPGGFGVTHIDYTEAVFVPVCRIKKSLGGEAGQPFADLVSESEGKWTDAHRQTGHTKMYVRFNTSHLEAGAPAISAVVKGAKLYDPRTGLTAWSANTALAVLAYLTSADFGLGAALSETGAAEFIAAANICDESVSLAAGGSESRYKANGAFRLSERPVDILERLLASMAGALTQVSDTWRVFAGAYEAATLTLAEKDFAGPIQIEPMPPRDRWANGAKGVFVNPASNWQPTDFPVIVPTAPYLAEDGGESIYADLDLSSFVTSSGQAQRLGRIEIRRRRSGLTVTALFKLTAWRAFTGHSVALTFAKYGWSAKEFTILDASFAVIQSGDGPSLGVQLVLKETNSAIYSWSAEDLAQGTPPSTSLPNPFSAPVPGVPTVIETLYSTSGSAGVKSRATVSWTAVIDPLVRSYEVSWKRVSDSAYQIIPVPQGTALAIDDLADGLYLFAVRSWNGIVRSSWSPYTTKELLGLTAPPATPTGFAVIKSAGFALASWVLSVDLDVQINGLAVIRHSPLTTGATWNDGVILDEFPGGKTEGLVALMTGTYMLKFIDSSGNFSASFASFVATEGLVTGFTTVATTTQQTAFTGAKTNVANAGSAIQLDGTTLIDSMVTNVDSWPFLDGLGGISATGSYAFDTYMDHTTVATRRLEADIKALSFDTGDFIDSRLDPIDSWGPFDGAVIDDCDVTLYYAATNDDPAGTPTWGPWTPFFVADVTARAEKFKLDFASGSSNHNISVSILAVDAKIPT